MARTLAMFTDTSLCIGCRACQVACKQWNELEMEVPEWTGGYQNHAHFTDKTFRLVRFIEEPKPQGEMAWLLMSDVCKHCADAGCLNAFFLLLAKPETYNLPVNPKLPARNVVVDSLLSMGSAVVVGLGALLAFRSRGNGGGDA